MAQGSELGEFEALLRSEDHAGQESKPWKIDPPVGYDGKGECSEEKRHIETLEREVYRNLSKCARVWWS